MAETAALVLLGLERKAFDLATLGLPDHCSGHAGAIHVGSPDLNAAVRTDEQDLVQLHFVADLRFQLLHAQEIILRHAILLPTGLDYRVHNVPRAKISAGSVVVSHAA